MQCYTVGTHSRCLRVWERPLGEIEGYFHKVKIIHTNRGPKKEGEREKIIFFYGKLATLGWDPDRWRWIDGGHFLTIPPRMDVMPSLIETRAPPGRRINGKVISQVTIGSTGHKFGTHYGPGKKRHSFGQFGIRRWPSMSGGPALHRPLSLNNVCFASLTLVNQSNINFGIASKLEGHGDGPRSSCTNFVGLERVTMIVSIGNKCCLGKEFLRDMAK